MVVAAAAILTSEAKSAVMVVVPVPVAAIVALGMATVLEMLRLTCVIHSEFAPA